MNKKLNHVFIFIFTIILCSNCRTDEGPEPVGTISGTVINGSTQSNEPISGVEVSIDAPLFISDITDSQGRFDLDPGKNGRYTIRFSNPNYEATTEEVNMSDGRIIELRTILFLIPPELSLSNSSIDFDDNDINLPIEISNIGKNILNWEVTEEVSWLSVNPTSGKLSVNETKSVIINVDRNNLNVAKYNASIVFSSSNGGGSQVLNVSMDVKSDLQVQSTDVSIGASENSESFTIRNRRSGTIEYFITTDKSWLTTTPDAGTVSTEIDPITINVDKSSLNSGNYTGSVFINSSAGSEQITVNVSVQ